MQIVARCDGSDMEFIQFHPTGICGAGRRGFPPAAIAFDG